MHATNHEQSIWEITSHTARTYPQLKGDIEADVCVVGAGITGLTTAILLKKAGRKVVVVEKDRIGAGTSGGTSAHLTNIVDFKYKSLIQSYGLNEARRVARSMMKAIDLIEDLQKEFNIDCAFKRVPGYYYAEDKAGVKDVQDEFEAAERSGVPVRILDQAPLSFRTEAAFVAENQAQFQPMDYLLGLAQAIEGDGCTIYEQTSVTNVKDGSPCVLETDHGTIRAQEVVLATHTPLGINFVHSKLNSYRSFVLAAKVSDLPPDGLYWDTMSPYNYIRTYERDGNQWVIVGGKDHKVGKDASDESFVALSEYTRAHFKVESIDSIWSAQFYDPTDSMPIIGKNPLGRHVYIATGFSGDGLTFGTLSGLMISNLIMHGQDEFEDLYHPTRMRLTGAGEFVKKNVHMTRHFLGDRVTTPSAKHIEALHKDEGCVIRDGTNYLAVYKDPTGQIKTYSAVCPHMKCILHWNEGEKSWDCPCHGSRFDTDGVRVDGPATSGLQAVEWKKAREPEEIS